MHIVDGEENRRGVEARMQWLGKYGMTASMCDAYQAGFLGHLLPACSRHPLCRAPLVFLLDCCSFDFIFHLIIQMEQKEKNVK